MPNGKKKVEPGFAGNVMVNIENWHKSFTLLLKPPALNFETIKKNKDVDFFIYDLVKGRLILPQKSTSNGLQKLLQQLHFRRKECEENLRVFQGTFEFIYQI